MKHPLNLKKNMTGFHPEYQWKMILAGMFLLVLAAVAYGGYLYVFAKQQIDSADAFVPASTTPAAEMLASPEKIQESFKVYKDRESVYGAIMNDLTKKNAAPAETAASTSTVIATSTDQ
jgi:hypothetical protein